MTWFNHCFYILVFTLSGLLSLESRAGTVQIDLNDFVGDPEVTIAADGTFANFTESEFATFVRLMNNPAVGDPNVIVPGPSTVLMFDFEFNEELGGDDEFSAILFEATDGPFFGFLDEFSVQKTLDGTHSFNLAPYVGLTLGLHFELFDLSVSGETLNSTATVSNLALSQVPAPAAVWLLSSAIGGLGLMRREAALSAALKNHLSPS